ncbi:esterase/lipase family protein [Nannocystis pusilla]|uniref:esterase/lipase family protein n=1 Tax=Nannocystis pusilla TaxID=889268 RepID=UPI003B7DAFF4
MLLVHGALQNGNVWLFPGGRAGSGAAYPGTTQKTGFVQALEATGRCTYAITFGNFHGDNYSQATNVANAIDRIKELTGQPKVDVIAWSKGVLSVDLYAGDVAAWDDFGPKHFERLAAEQAKRVPAFGEDVRVYVPLSGPHLGIDLNFRHPYDDLLIYSTLENAPIGQGPVTWGWMSALQCVNWGYGGSPLYPNQFAQSVCDGRGGTWPDFFSRIYSSNITGLDAQGGLSLRAASRLSTRRTGRASSASTSTTWRCGVRWTSTGSTSRRTSASCRRRMTCARITRSPTARATGRTGRSSTPTRPSGARGCRTSSRTCSGATSTTTTATSCAARLRSIRPARPARRSTSITTPRTRTTTGGGMGRIA